MPHTVTGGNIEPMHCTPAHARWLSLLLAGPPLATAAVPTYTGQIAAILQTHCVSCHRDGSSAASVPLVTYDDVRSRGAALLSQVDSGAMPPWPIDAAHSVPMQNDPRLSAAQLEALRAWVAGGTPLGSATSSAPSTSPTAAQAETAQGWNDPQHRMPDAVVALPPIPVPAQGELPYMRVLIKVVTPEDRWIGALQTIPGDAAVVHHMGIAEVRLPPGVGPKQVRELAALAARMGTPERSMVDIEPAVIDTQLTGDYDMLAAFTPGEGYEAFPAGTGKLLKAGDTYYINFNIHYTTDGTATSDRSRMGLWFLKSPPERQLFRAPSPGRTILAEGHELYPDDTGSKAEGTDVAIPPIPPYADNFELIGITPFDRAATLYSFQPHAHLRAKDFHYQLVLPDGRVQTLLSIPRYDYHWQLSYTFATPVAVPAGSKLVVSAHYDNSAANQHLREFSLSNPAAQCGPDKYAYFRSQNQTWDEMFSPIVQYALPTAQRENRRVATVSTRGCLVAAAGTKWSLTGALPSRPTQSPTITHAEMTEAPLHGHNTYHLIGVEPFRPQSLTGRLVLVKGLDSPGQAASINVTAMQELGGNCP